jgi:hypothetical protein
VERHENEYFLECSQLRENMLFEQRFLLKEFEFEKFQTDEEQ